MIGVRREKEVPPADSDSASSFNNRALDGRTMTQNADRCGAPDPNQLNQPAKSFPESAESDTWYGPGFASCRPTRTNC